MKIIDLTGQRFGALTVTGRAITHWPHCGSPAAASSAALGTEGSASAGRVSEGAATARRRNGRTLWNCRCDCGNKCVQEGYILRQGIVTSCGCGMHRASLRRGVETGMQVDYTGQTFGRLTAIRRVSAGEWLWKCECGNETIAKPADVKNGNPASCGCGLKEASRKRIVEDNVLEFFDGTSISNLRSIVAGKKRSTNTSGHTGIKIRHNKSGDTYVARIMLRGKQINLGSFPTMEEAVAARKDAEAKYFGAIIDQYEHQKKEDE